MTAAELSKMTGKTSNSNMNSVAMALCLYGPKFGLNLPHRLAHYLAQLGHESGSFRYDREIWGNTPAQLRYDIRTDLGNTPERDGDGKLYMGRTGIQITGKYNYTTFRNWVWAHVDPKAPDFVAFPEMLNTDPWEGLAPVWFWMTRNLNAYADQNDIETITRKINGGLNGYADRVARYPASALVMLGRAANDVRGFQKTAGLTADGIAGPRTRAALHGALMRLPKRGV
jgi:putative chitinase